MIIIFTYIFDVQNFKANTKHDTRPGLSGRMTMPQANVRIYDTQFLMPFEDIEGLQY